MQRGLSWPDLCPAWRFYPRRGSPRPDKPEILAAAAALRNRTAACRFLWPVPQGTGVLAPGTAGNEPPELVTPATSDRKLWELKGGSESSELETPKRVHLDRSKSGFLDDSDSIERRGNGIPAESAGQTPALVIFRLSPSTPTPEPPAPPPAAHFFEPPIAPAIAQRGAAAGSLVSACPCASARELL
jgi:hypothetical protein